MPPEHKQVLDHGLWSRVGSEVLHSHQWPDVNPAFKFPDLISLECHSSAFGTVIYPWAQAHGGHKAHGDKGTAMETKQTLQQVIKLGTAFIRLYSATNDEEWTSAAEDVVSRSRDLTASEVQWAIQLTCKFIARHGQYK
jgi:hypothetical protein